MPPPPACALRYGAVAAVLGMITIVCLLLGVGNLLLGSWLPGGALCLGGAVSGSILIKLWPRIAGN